MEVVTDKDLWRRTSTTVSTTVLTTVLTTGMQAGNSRRRWRRISIEPGGPPPQYWPLTGRLAGRHRLLKKKKTWKGFSCWHRPAEDSYLGGVGVTEQDAVAVDGRECQRHLGLEGGGLRAISRSPFYPVLLQGRAPLWQGLHQLPGALGTHTQTQQRLVWVAFSHDWAHTPYTGNTNTHSIGWCE